MAETNVGNEIIIKKCETGMFQYFLIFSFARKVKLESQLQTIQTQFHANCMKNGLEMVGKSDSSKKFHKKVKFADKPSIRTIYTWRFAHKQARTDKWQEITRDHERFGKRISRLSLIISPILKKKLERIRKFLQK